jgi:hypothetical protein
MEEAKVQNWGCRTTRGKKTGNVTSISEQMEMYCGSLHKLHLLQKGLLITL